MLRKKNGWAQGFRYDYLGPWYFGKPAPDGNTETLLDSFLDGARAAGASVEKVALVDLDYTPCRGCNACHKTGECIVKDEAPALYDRILAADCVAIASPIYSMGITAQLKGFIDRAHVPLGTEVYPQNVGLLPGTH